MTRPSWRSVRRPPSTSAECTCLNGRQTLSFIKDPCLASGLPWGGRRLGMNCKTSDQRGAVARSRLHAGTASRHPRTTTATSGLQLPFVFHPERKLLRRSAHGSAQRPTSRPRLPWGWARFRKVRTEAYRRRPRSDQDKHTLPDVLRRLGGGWRWRSDGFGNRTTFVQDYKVGTVVSTFSTRTPNRRSGTALPAMPCRIARNRRPP